MSNGIADLVRQQREIAAAAAKRGAVKIRREAPGQARFWVIALVIGIAAGAAAVGFRVAISALQQLFYGADDVLLASHAANLPWQKVLIIPVLGGLAVGLILKFLVPDGATRSVAHVIEGAALRRGRVEKQAGFASALVSLITLSSGGSSGREGPVVHLGAVLSSYVSNWMRADAITARDLMGCAVAAAVSASFNAPIAGALFALEVVLRHFAVHAFAPIVIASVAGTVVSRIQMGNVTEFMLPVHTLGFYGELPAYMILGLVCGLVAALVMRAVFIAEDFGNALQKATGIPLWLRPVCAGLLLGGIAILFPHVIGVGYETTSRALTGDLLFWEAVVYAVTKAVAFAITIAGRMGGGAFSPSLMLGALTGLAFGWIATSIYPSATGTEGLYAMAGMGAVAAAVLGAPISTTLIVFELTGDWQAGVAVMVTVSLASALSSRLVDRSFFLTQIERRGVHIAAGPQAYLLGTIRVKDVLCPTGAERTPPGSAVQELVDQDAVLTPEDTLETVLPLFDRAGTDFLPVVADREADSPETLGVVFHVDALKTFNRALAETAREEHS